MLFSFSLLLYNTLNEFSTDSPYDDLFYALYEVIITAWVIFFYLLFDQDISFQYTYKEKDLGFKLSHYYSHVRTKVIGTTIRYYVNWFFFAIFTAAVTVYVPFFSIQSKILGENGRTDGKYLIGFMNYTAIVMAINFIVFLGTRNYDITIWCLYAFGILLYFPLFVSVDNYSEDANL